MKHVVAAAAAQQNPKHQAAAAPAAEQPTKHVAAAAAAQQHPTASRQQLLQLQNNQ